MAKAMKTIFIILSVVLIAALCFACVTIAKKGDTESSGSVAEQSVPSDEPPAESSSEPSEEPDSSAVSEETEETSDISEEPSSEETSEESSEESADIPYIPPAQ